MFNQYVLILVWIGFVSLLQRSFYREEYNELTGEYGWRVKPVFAFMVMMPLIWMAMNRGWFADTGAYISAYRAMPNDFSGIARYLATVSKDKGFYLLSCILRVVLGSDFTKYLLVIALLQSGVLVYFYRKYTMAYVFAIFLFITSTDYISWMFNGIRQFTAVAIVLLGTWSMIKKKWVTVIVLVLIASTMHQSALIMLPILYLAQGKVWNKRTLLFMVGILLAVVFVGRFTTLMDSALANTQYANMVSDYTEWQDDGTNPVRVLVYSIPAILSFWGRFRIREVNDPVINLSTNMSIVTMGLYLISMVTSGIFIGRLPIYTSLFNYVLLPWEIDHLFERNIRRWIKTVAIIGYLGFYYYGMHFQNALI